MSRIHTSHDQGLTSSEEEAASLAHRSRNALQRVQASVNRLRRKLADNAEALTMLDDIEQSTDLLSELFNAVQDSVRK